MPAAMMLPWEVGFAAMVFGTGTPVGMPAESFKIDLEEQMEVDQADKVLPSLGLKKTRLAMADEDRADREKEIEKWLVIARAVGTENKMVKLMEDIGPVVLEDALAKEKIGTLKVRAVAILLYIRWASSKNVSPFPLSTEKV